MVQTCCSLESKFVSLHRLGAVIVQTTPQHDAIVGAPIHVAALVIVIQLPMQSIVVSCVVFDSVHKHASID